MLPGGSYFKVAVDTCLAGISISLDADSALNLYPMRADQIEIQINTESLGVVGDLYGDGIGVQFNPTLTGDEYVTVCVSHDSFLVTNEYALPNFVS